jgi:hypothetical protein
MLWLNTNIFEHLTSHHPLVSPASDLSSPFVRKTFEILAERGTRVLVHAGTAEWFFRPSKAFVECAEETGVDIEFRTESGGFHIEGCLIPGELGGAGGRLVRSLREWVVNQDAGQDRCAPAFCGAKSCSS